MISTKSLNPYWIQAGNADLYLQGWSNFGSAWDIWTSSNASWWQRGLAGSYMTSWGGAHVMLAGGSAMFAYAGAASLAEAAGICISAATCRERVFWSGGNVAKNAAEAYARANNGITIGQTIAGRALSFMNKVVPYQYTKPLWDYASAQFAKGSSGVANVFIYTPQYNPNGTWATIEKVTLQANPYITSIIEHIVP